MNRYFKILPEKYEQIRTAMDAESGFPNEKAVTWFSPAAEADKAEDGCCLIAVIEPIAQRFVAEACNELTEEEYKSLLPAVEEAL
jgi:hypothetical protein